MARFLKYAALALALAASPFIAILAVLASWMVYEVFVPVFSASFRIAEIDMVVKLDFFRINDPFGDGLDKSGRYLTMQSPQGEIRYNMLGYNWARRARTGVYLTGAGNIAILGPDGADILVDTGRMKISDALRTSAGGWTYLGAFDFVEPLIRSRDPSLRFIPPAEQDECVLDSSQTKHEPRAGARRDRCPRLQSGT
jgi:hypothetical protein